MAALIEIIKYIVLGLVQGIGEFLPISSSGHLLLTERIFGIEEGGMLMTVLLHVATLAAVLIVYRKQVIEIIKHPIQWKTLWLIVATAVTAALMLTFKKVFDDAEDGRYLGYCFIFTAILLTVAEYAKTHFARGIDCTNMKWWRACPAILGGAVMELPDLFKYGTGDFTWYGILIAMAVAGVSGWLAIRFMLRVITKRSFNGFIAYTAALGVLVLLDKYVLHLFF